MIPDGISCKASCSFLFTRQRKEDGISPRNAPVRPHACLPAAVACLLPCIPLLLQTAHICLAFRRLTYGGGFEQNGCIRYSIPHSLPLHHPLSEFSLLSHSFFFFLLLCSSHQSIPTDSQLSHLHFQYFLCSLFQIRSNPVGHVSATI